jgi:hypothetical protein
VSQLNGCSDLLALSFILRPYPYFPLGGDNSENLEKAIGKIPGIGLAASNGSCFSPPSTHNGARTWLAFDLGVDWDSVKRVSN